MRWIHVARVSMLAAALGCCAAVHAAVQFVNLGTNAPPATLGGVAVQPFDTAPQAAIPTYTPNVTTIPGSPIAGNLTASTGMTKFMIGTGWSTWSHGYAGPVFTTYANTNTLTLPPNTAAFYLYVEPRYYAPGLTVTATSNSGTTSGAINVSGNAGANGFGFFTVTPGETIASITITTSDAGMAFAEFGIASANAGAASAVTPVPTLGQGGLLALAALLGAAALGQRRLRRG